MHDRRPDRARVVDVDVEIARGERVERDRRAERRHAARREAGLRRDVLAEDLGEDVLLGERLRADRDHARRAARAHRRRRSRVEQRARRAARRPGPTSPPPLADARLEQADQLVEAERERGRRRAAHQHRGVVARREAAEDVVAEAGRADRRRERRGAHHPDRRRAHARDDHGQRERQLDAPELLARRHPDAARGFAHGGIDAREAGHRVAQDRQQAVERERDQRGQGADPAHGDPAAREQRAEPREQRHHHREQRETRDRLDRARGAEQRGLERGAAVDRDTERDREQRARAERGERQLEMGRQVAGQERELLPHDSASGRAARRAPRPGAAACAAAPRRGRRRARATAPTACRPARAGPRGAPRSDRRAGAPRPCRG